MVSLNPVIKFTTLFGLLAQCHPKLYHLAISWLPLLVLLDALGLTPLIWMSPRSVADALDIR